MKTEIETTAAALTQMFRQNHNPTPAPSLRVPVTSSNREKLRRLRAAEMFAWEAADRHPRQPLSQQSCLA